MRSKYFYAINILFLTVLLSVGSGSSFAQGNGKGNKGGGNKGGGQQGGGHQRQVAMPQQNRQPAPQMRQQHPQMQKRMHEPQAQERPQREHPRFNRQQNEQPMRVQQQRQERQIDRGNRQEQVWQQQRGWERMREDSRSERRGNQKRQEIFRGDKRQDQFPQVFARERENRGNERERENYSGADRADRRRWRDTPAQDGIEPLRQNGPPSWSNAWPNNHGYQRSNEVHERNALRKAVKNQARVAKWFINDRYAYLPEYRTNRSAFDEHELWRENFLRSIVSNVRYVNNGYDNYYSYQPTYISTNYDPVYYDNGYYGYPNFASSYYYGGAGYYPAYASDYDLHSEAYYYDAFPYDVFADSSYDNSYSRSLFSQLIAYGYDQGYLEGLAARRAGYGTRYFDDPYVYEPTYYSTATYDPYSYSLGENRRCLSNGYQLGYMDALHGGNDYDVYEYGNTDLVSAFVSVLSTVL